MPLTPSTHWPEIGAFIGCINSLVNKQAEFEQDVVDAVEVIDVDFNRLQVLPSFITNMRSASQSITNGKSNIVATITSYHLNVLADEIASEASTISGVITDLFAAMNAYSPAQTFLTNGNFHALYRDEYGRLDVPNAASGFNTVDDSLGD